jgi:hypothetical protein
VSTVRRRRRRRIVAVWPPRAVVIGPPLEFEGTPSCRVPFRFDISSSSVVVAMAIVCQFARERTNGSSLRHGQYVVRGGIFSEGPNS